MAEPEHTKGRGGALRGLLTLLLLLVLAVVVWWYFVANSSPSGDSPLAPATTLRDGARRAPAHA